MPIPDFQTLMLPLLRHLAGGAEHGNADTVAALAQEFQLTPEDLAQLLPSGRQAVFRNRIAWAKAHFKGAKLIESPRRGVYRITQRGRDVLSQNPTRIDLQFLHQIPDYREWRTPGEQAPPPAPPPAHTELTPQEHIELGFHEIREQVGSELLQRIKEAPPEFLEQLVVDLLVAMGYGGTQEDAGSAIGRSGDGGVDGIIKEDRLGLEAIYVQAKRWDGTVGRPDIQRFAGALQGQKARKGIFITTSSFSREAKDYAAGIDSRIVLIDGERLASLMIEHDIGVTEEASYAVKRIDSDYFNQE